MKRKQLAIPYYAASAMRGPDSTFKHSSTLKSLLTARIRTVYYQHIDCYGEYNDSPIPKNGVLPILLRLSEAWQDVKSHHYINHIYDGLLCRKVQAKLGIRQCQRIIKHIEELERNQ